MIARRHCGRVDHHLADRTERETEEPRLSRRRAEPCTFAQEGLDTPRPLRRGENHGRAAPEPTSAARTKIELRRHFHSPRSSVRHSHPNISRVAWSGKCARVPEDRPFTSLQHEIGFVYTAARARSKILGRCRNAWQLFAGIRTRFVGHHRSTRRFRPRQTIRRVLYGHAGTSPVPLRRRSRVQRPLGREAWGPVCSEDR